MIKLGAVTMTPSYVKTTLPTTEGWTIKEALVLLPKLEEGAKTFGLHLALGGSVLHSGSSKKDLDILVYNHNTEQPGRPDEFRKFLTEYLNLTKLFQIKYRKESTDQKEVWVAKYGNRRIDFFFL